MKRLAAFKSSLILILCLAIPHPAQSNVDCDQLRSSITELEQLATKTMSPSIQQLHKDSLLKLYTQFSQCIERDISTTTSMLKAVSGTDAAPAVEAKLQALKKEKSETENKITIIKNALNLAKEPSPSLAEPRSDFLAKDKTSETLSTRVGAPNTSALSPTNTTPVSPTTRRAISLTSVAGPQTTFECALEQTYADAPTLLTDIVSRDAADAVNKNDPELATASASKMILYAIVDAASPSSSQLLRSLEAYQYLGETARTDKQLGGPSNSDGAVSAIEKPGFAELLGFAIEHGAINKEIDGTNLTLSTSLYSLYTFNKERTAETYARAGILNRVGISATFGLENQTDELANVRRNNLAQWSVKARLFGDRSTRAPAYQRFWNAQIKPLISARLEAIGTAIEGLSNQIAGYDQFEEDFELCLVDVVGKRMKDADYIAASPQVRQQMLTELMLGRLKSNVFDRVKDGRLKLDASGITTIETQYVPALKVALDNLKGADSEIEKKLDELRKGPLATFAYTNHRTVTGSDFSEAKFLFEQEKGFMGPLKLTGNLGLSLYHRPDRSLNQKRLRDFSAALSFEGSSDSPFTEAENQSKITYSFVGRYERLFENRRMFNRTADIGTLQFVTEIPLFRGLSLPFSLTYSSATEEQRKQGFRFNFGTRFDMDKLVELLRMNSRL